MRRSSAQARRERTRRRARAHGWRAALPRAVLRGVGACRLHPWLCGVPALALLVCAGAWVGRGVPLAHGAAAAPSHPIAVGRAAPPSRIPNVVQWVDPADQTGYSAALSTTGQRQAGSFVFTLPDGDQIRGLVPIQAQPDGTSTQQASSSLGACASGALATAHLQSSKAALARSGGKSAPNGFVTPIVFALTTRIGPAGLVAFAGLSYADATDAAGVSSVCSSGTFDYQVQAGCTAVVCTDPLATAAPGVAKHSQAVLQATATNSAADWSAVYQLSAQSVQGQYSAADFANALIAQTKSKGKITQIAPITTPPSVQYDAAGQAYFAVTQTVTLDQNGSTTSQQVTSYYLLEGGQWRFWFSA